MAFQLHCGKVSKTMYERGVNMKDDMKTSPKERRGCDCIAWISIGVLMAITILACCWLNGMLEILRTNKTAIGIYNERCERCVRSDDATRLLLPWSVASRQCRDGTDCQAYKEAEETLQRQMTTWLTVFGFFVTLLGVVAPLAGYLLQRKSLEAEHNRITEDMSKTADAVAKKLSSDVAEDASKKAMNEAQKLIDMAVENAKSEMGWEVLTVSYKHNIRLGAVEQWMNGETQNLIYEEVLGKAQRDDQVAILTVVYMLISGDGKMKDGSPVKRNESEARAWAQKAVGKNIDKAKGVLAIMCLVGMGGGKDEEKAQALFQSAAAKGDSFSQYHLGLMYEFGRGGLKRDLNRAKELYNWALGSGYKDAERRIAQINEKIKKSKFGRCDG